MLFCIWDKFLHTYLNAKMKHFTQTLLDKSKLHAWALNTFSSTMNREYFWSIPRNWRLFYGFGMKDWMIVVVVIRFLWVEALMLLRGGSCFQARQWAERTQRGYSVFGIELTAHFRKSLVWTAHFGSAGHLFLDVITDTGLIMKRCSCYFMSFDATRKAKSTCKVI